MTATEYAQTLQAFFMVPAALGMGEHWKLSNAEADAGGEAIAGVSTMPIPEPVRVGLRIVSTGVLPWLQFFGVTVGLVQPRIAATRVLMAQRAAEHAVQAREEAAAVAVAAAVAARPVAPAQDAAYTGADAMPDAPGEVSADAVAAELRERNAAMEALRRAQL